MRVVRGESSEVDDGGGSNGDGGVRRRRGERLQPYLVGTMFDPSRVIERELSNGTVVRLRIEELGEGAVMVHEALRRRRGGGWSRWPALEGEQQAAKLRLELGHEVS